MTDARGRRFTALGKASIVFLRRKGVGMAKRGHEFLRSVAPSNARSSGASSEPAAHSTEFQGFGDPGTIFNFWGRVQGVDYSSLSPAQQDAFTADFARNLGLLKTWCVQEQWPPDVPPSNLKIFVSDDYKNAKSLLPVALGQRGRMEFPAWKVVAGEAPIMHELAHVYFPNGNRFIAEGLAIYLQAALGSNPAFPNFGRPLHELARELLLKMVPEFARSETGALEKVRLTDLDKIATPSPLRLRVGLNLYQDDPSGQAHIYAVVGSFAKFLIETHGIRRFRTLYDLTPLRAFERETGSPDRWRDVYGASLGEIETEWKANFYSAPGFV
jgi:hypothetical protein